MNRQNLDKKINEFLAGFNKPKPTESLPVAEPQLEQKAEAEAVLDRVLETSAEQPEANRGLAAVLPVQPAAAAVEPAKSPLYYQVEGILAEGLEEQYQKLDPQKQLEFKKQGEAAASKITQLLKSARVRVKEIFRLILKWLGVIPGLSRYFLEQEAKIKADRVLALKKNLKK